MPLVFMNSQLLSAVYAQYYVMPPSTITLNSFYFLHLWSFCTKFHISALVLGSQLTSHLHVHCRQFFVYNRLVSSIFCLLLHSNYTNPEHLTMDNEVSTQKKFLLWYENKEQILHNTVNSQLLCTVLREYYGVPLCFNNPKLLSVIKIDWLVMVT